MKRRITVILGAVLLLCTGLALAQVNPVQLSVTMYAVEDGDGSERLQESTTARRGQVVEYRIRAVNGGSTALQAGTVVVTIPVPEGVIFLANSARPVTEDILIEYQAPGADYMTAPVLAEVDGVRTVAQPDSYTGVRFTLLAPMAAGQEEVFTFRVIVN